MNSVVSQLRQFTTWVFFVPPVDDPDETRRRAILVRIITALVAVCLIILLDGLRHYSLQQILSGYFLFDIWNIPDARLLFYGEAIGCASFVLIWGLNRKSLRSLGWLPGVTLLFIVTVLVAFSDTPFEIANGRSLMNWVLPIALAPLILPSWTAFLAATASAAAITVIAFQIADWVNWYVILALYVIAFVSWLSARALEQALHTARDEAEKSRVILENIADGVVVVDEAGLVQVANPAAHNILGSDLESAVQQAEARIETSGRIVEFSWAHIQGVGRAAVLRDVTRQVEIERAKDALLGTVSHELRTPLAAIGGFAEVIGMLSQNEKISEMAGRIVANVGRLKGLVDSLLDQAQIQAGTLKLTFADTSPLKLAGDVHSLLAGLAAEKGLTFEVKIDAETPDMVRCDPGRLHQVLVNLLGNAIKFTDQGTVTLHLFRCYEHTWGFSVTDTGDGIPAARLPDIFKPFRRGSDYATRTRQGAGLGLSITQQLVELMGGETRVQSKVGQGTTFTVTLPVGAQP